MVCHEVNKAVCEANGDMSQPSWENAPEWQRKSAMNGVKFHLSGNHNVEDSHVNWMEQKIADGWIYGPVKDEVAKTHPCLVPFNELPKEQQLKDYIFRAIVHSLSVDKPKRVKKTNI